MKSFRDIRVLPVVLTAIFGLAVLKVAGLVIDGGYVFDYQPQSTKRSWAQDAFNFPGANKTGTADITGSIQEKPKEEATTPVASAPEVAKPNGVVVYPEQSQPVSASERAILERLQSRRQELEARIGTSSAQKSEADAARFKGIITMYEGMKPKDAAKVFDRLEMSVLFEIASQIAPRKMSDILGLMSPEAAERLTVELARRAGADKSASVADLPKIEGKVLPQRSN
jgi:flagellar motility protein MotE (MotC chaperone)